MDKTKVIITNKQKEVKLPTGIRMIIRRACIAVLQSENFGSSAEISVTLVNNKEIHEINKEFRNIDSATDVLSFPLGEDGVYDSDPTTGLKMLGDIVISVERALAQSQEYGHSFQREMAFLTVHSMLHLLGYDHVGGGIEAEIMREKEEEVLLKMGLTREVTF